jgi:hypothetical protein
MTRHVDAYRILRTAAYQRFVPDPEGLVPLRLGVTLKNGQAVISSSHPTIVFRYPSRNDDTRTLIATVLDEKGFLYSKGYVHGLRTDGATVPNILALLGYLNSFICDWWVRRFTDRHVTLPVLKNLPLPRWSEKDRTAVAELVSCLLVKGGTKRLPGGSVIPVDPRLQTVEEFDLLATIERRVLQGFGLRHHELRVALEGFSDNACPPQLRDKLFTA